MNCDEHERAAVEQRNGDSGGAEIKEEAVPRHVMVDIESLGRRAGCAITQIGLVEFFPSLTGERCLGAGMCVEVSAKDCARFGLALEAETLGWWIDRARDGREVPGFTREASPLDQALCEVRRFFAVRDDRPVLVWCRGASFDFPILKEAFRVTGQEVPWRYHEERCARTFCALPWVPQVDHEERAAGVAHDALADAKAQAMELCEAWRAMAVDEFIDEMALSNAATGGILSKAPLPSP